MMSSNNYNASTKQIEVKEQPSTTLQQINSKIELNDAVTSSSPNGSIKDITNIPKVKQQLSKDFQPGPYSVIIGRGKSVKDAIGNKRLTIMASTFLEKYSKTNSKSKKTIIVSQIVNIFHDACQKTNDVAFIKYINGSWYEVSNNLAREKVGHVLRDMLHANYKSSSKSKVARRRKLREEARSVSSTSLDSQQQQQQQQQQSKPSDYKMEEAMQNQQSTTTMNKCYSMPITPTSIGINATTQNQDLLFPLKQRSSSCPPSISSSFYDQTITRLFNETATYRDTNCQSPTPTPTTTTATTIHQLSNYNSERNRSVTCRTPPIFKKQHSLMDDEITTKLNIDDIGMISRAIFDS